MAIDTYEVVKQYVFRPDVPTVNTVKGRISRNLDPMISEPFMWEMSHEYRRKDGGPTYQHRRSFTTIEEAETWLFLYAKGFTNIGVKLNDDY